MFPPLLPLAGELLQRIERWRGRRRRLVEWLVVLVARLEVLGIVLERVGDRFGTDNRAGLRFGALLHPRGLTAAVSLEICVQCFAGEATVAALGPGGAQLTALV